MTVAGEPLYGDEVLIDRRTTQAPQRVAWALAALAVGLAVTAVALPLAGGHDYLTDLLGTPEVVVALSFSVTGALLVGTPQARRMGWLLLAIGSSAALYAGSVSYTVLTLGGDVDAALPADADMARLTAWLSTWTWLPSWGLVSAVLPQVLPYGRPLSPRWRPAVWLAALVIATGVVVLAVSPGEVGPFTAVDNPFTVPALAGAVDPMFAGLDVALSVVTLLAVASLVVRVVRADGAERRQVGWVGYAVVLVVVIVFLGAEHLRNLAVLLIPAGIAVAALRYRLYDLDLVVNRTLVAVLLLVGGALAYLALVAWVGSLVGESAGAVPFVAAFAVALAFHPARIRLQRWVDRLFFGRRGDPYSLLRDLDRTLREAATPREALAAAAELLRDGLRLSGVQLLVPLPSGGDVRETAGTTGPRDVTVPLVLHEQQVGELRAGGRGAAPLSGTDVRVLHTLAGPLASAAYALRLTGDLEESRRHILETREDERRRLRRDLHDGLGPQLAGVVMGVDVIRSTLARGDSERAGELAAGVGEQARGAVEDVRRLVTGLRPPVLDDLGLLGALQAAGPTMHGEPEVRFSVSGDLTGLPAAVEVAAYRIASEAVTNAVRHAEATTIEVELAVGQRVMGVRVSDDGRGLAPDAPTGVGMVSMRERAAELGGRCSVTSAGRGTTVAAELPLGSS